MHHFYWVGYLNLYCLKKEVAILFKKNKEILITLASAMVITAISTLKTSFAMSPKVNTDYFILDPYKYVDWNSYGQYKAGFHAHTTESDGSNTPKEMIEDHYAKGFDILAITDHNFTTTTWDRTDRPENKTYLTSERLKEIDAGIGRNGRGMLAVKYSNEQSIANHLNTFFADYNNKSGDTLEDIITRTEELGGISHIDHPGGYTGGSSDIVKGEALSKDPTVYGKYIELFKKYKTLVGMEIINEKDVDSLSDRILWDSILSETMDVRNPVWGFSNDDTHSVDKIGFSYNMMLMPKNNVDNLRNAMKNGTFYAVAKIAKRELGPNFKAEGPTPVIRNIKIDQEENSITIKGSHYNTVQWIADGKIIATGNTIDLNDFEDKFDSYVRAQLIGNGGISFTQPFGVNKYTINNLQASIEETHLSKDLKKSLLTKLNDAEKSMRKDKDNYVDILNGFSKEVKTLVGSNLTEEEVHKIIEAVDEIILNLKPQN